MMRVPIGAAGNGGSPMRPEAHRSTPDYNAAARESVPVPAVPTLDSPAQLPRPKVGAIFPTRPQRSPILKLGPS